MSLGGGSWVTQNKSLPGTYINVTSLASANLSISDRGVCTVPIQTDWGPDGSIIKITAEDFNNKCFKIFGVTSDDDSMKPLREIFRNASVLYAYRLNGNGSKASCTYGTAKYAGIGGNNLKIVIAANVDDNTLFDVSIYYGTTLVDEQTVASAADLVSNEYVDFDTTATLSATAGTSFTLGTNNTVTGTDYQSYFDLIENYTFNTMGLATDDATVKALALAFNKRLRDELGVKFQLVLFDYVSANYMGCISVKNKCLDGMSGTGNSITYPHKPDLVYWVTGIQCACAVNVSCQNAFYDGEYDVDVNFSQSQLSQLLDAGNFVLHNANGDIRVLDDINTLTTFTDNMSSLFRYNQTIRIIDKLANDDAYIFNTRYLGKIQNNDIGRTSLWLDLVKNREELQSMGAISDFDSKDVTVSVGEDRRSVVIENVITIVNSMTKLYITTTIS